MSISKVPFDFELRKQLDQLPELDLTSSDVLVAVENILPATISHEEHVFQGPDSNELKVSIFRRKESKESSGLGRLGIYHIHGGGMIAGNRFTTILWPLKVVDEFDAVCVSIEYRLAPVHPDPAPIEDCYAGLMWMTEHAGKLGINPTQILLNGVSAGGGLAAGVALLSRDRNGPKLIGQALFAPMLDDRSNSVSAHQFEGVGIWDREMNIYGWTALLGERRGTEHVSIYASPARAKDLTGMSPSYIDVGSAETFRDENIQYAQKLCQDGIQCELHVWPGAFHGSELFCPDAALSVMAAKPKMDWVRRLLRTCSMA